MGIAGAAWDYSVSFGWSCDFVVTIKLPYTNRLLDWIKTTDLGFASSWGAAMMGWDVVTGCFGRFFWDGVSSAGNAIGVFLTQFNYMLALASLRQRSC